MATDQARCMSLSPAFDPLYLPNLRATAGVLDSISLCRLLSELSGVLGQVFNLARPRTATHQTWVLLWSPKIPPVSCQDLRPGRQNHEVWRDFRYVGFTEHIQPIVKVQTATIQFIEGPCLDANTVGFRASNQIQCDLWLGFKLNVLWYVVFFRRTGSSHHCSGRYSWMSSNVWKSSLL